MRRPDLRQFPAISTPRLCGGLIIIVGASAAGAPPTPISEPRKTAVLELVALMEEAVKDCKDVKLKDYFGSGADDVGYEQVRRTPDGDPEDATFADAFAALKALINGDRLFLATMRDAFGRAFRRDGQDSDRIDLERHLVQEFTDAGLGTPREKAIAKMQIMATLANELTHVFQNTTGLTNKQDCDSEADSDSFSIKVLTAFRDALTRDDASGLANTNLDAIKNDAQAIAGFDNCLGEIDVSSAADIQAILDAVNAKLGSETTADGYVRRRKRFRDDVTGALDWSRWYRGGNDGEPALFTVEDVALRQGFYATGADGTDTFVPAVAPGFSVCDSVGFSIFSGVTVFAVATADSSGARTVSLFTDNDNDEVPELSSQLDIAFAAGPFGLADMNDMLLIPGAAPDFDVPGVSDHLIMYDRTTGRVRLIQLTSTGSLLTIPSALFQDPLLTNAGGFTHFLGAITPPSNAAVVRFVFGQKLHPPTEVIWFDAPIVPGPAIAFTTPGQTIEQAYESVPYPSMVDRFEATPTLTGAPGSIVSLSSIGSGAQVPLAIASVGSSGVTASVLPAAPIAAPDILLAQDNLGRASTLFVPRLGLPIGSVELDLNSDLASDRLDLVDHPPRLYISTGSPSLPPTSAVRLVESEQVVELGGVGGFDGASTPGDIRFATPIELVELSLAGSTPIVVVQRKVDFDLDLLDNDAVVVRRNPGSDFFVADFYIDAGLASMTLEQSLPLPVGFEPGRIEYLDINGDARLDVRLGSFMAAPPICLLNSANPPPTRFSASQCKACPGDADGSGVVDFDDVSSVIANWGASYMPGTGAGDADASGVVDFNDINFVLSNWAVVCP